MILCMSLCLLPVKVVQAFGLEELVNLSSSNSCQHLLGEAVRYLDISKEHRFRTEVLTGWPSARCLCSNKCMASKEAAPAISSWENLPSCSASYWPP